MLPVNVGWSRERGRSWVFHVGKRDSMVFLAEFLTWFLPESVEKRRSYVLHAVLVAAACAIAFCGTARRFGLPLGSAAAWGVLLAAGVAAGYALAFPVHRKKLRQRHSADVSDRSRPGWRRGSGGSDRNGSRVPDPAAPDRRV